MTSQNSSDIVHDWYACLPIIIITLDYYSMDFYCWIGSKNEYCRENHIVLIRLPYTLSDDEVKSEIYNYKSRIRNE